MACQRALAMFYMSSGRAKEAEAPLKVLAARPGDTQSQMMLGDYYIMAQRVDEGTKVLEQLAMIRLRGRHSPPCRHRLLAKRVAEAHRKVDEARQAAEEHAGRVAEGDFLLSERKVDEAWSRRAGRRRRSEITAAQHCSDGVSGAQRSGRGDYRVQRGSSSIRGRRRPRAARGTAVAQGATPAAVQFAEEAVRDAPGSLNARLVLARSLIVKGDIPRAEGIMKTLLQERADVAPVHEQMGMLLLVKKDKAGARREFDRALALEPVSIVAMRGVLSLELGDKNNAGARQIIEEAVRKSPRNTELMLLEAGVYDATGDKVQQEATLRRSWSRSGEPAGLRAAGVLVLASRQADQARAEYEGIAAKEQTVVARRWWR